MLIILVSPLLAERLRISDLVLLLLAGTMLGPNGFGVMDRGAAITMFGSIGLLYIMFIAGLEIDLHRFVRTKQRSIVFGLLTFLIPQILGTLAGYYILNFNWSASVLLASMFASHTLLAYPIASRLGIARSEPVVITVGGTIITDTLALLVLAVVADSAKGAELGVSFWISLVASMAALIALIWFGIPRLTGWFFRNVTEKGGAQFVFVLGVVCGCSYLSHFAKMEPIIGAFLVGAVFNRLIPEQSTLMNRLVFVGHNLFIPFFLISVGMLVNVKALATSPRGWLVAATMVIGVIGSKYLAAWLTRKIYGYDRAAGNVIFGLSVVQAAATLAAVIVGYDLKIFDESVLNGAIAMIMITCPLGAWAVERYGRALVNRAENQPDPVPREQRLLVAVGESGASARLLGLAFLLHDRRVGGKIHPITVVSDLDNYSSAEAIARGEKLLGQCLAQAASADIPVVPGIRLDSNPSDGIIRAARELRSTLVLAGWGRRQLIRGIVFGSTTGHLLKSCPARLLFARIEHPLNTEKNLLLPLPPLSERRADLFALLRDARQLARQIGTELRIYCSAEEAARLRRRLKTIRPDGPLRVIESDSWGATREKFFGDIADGDLVLLPCERRESPLWQPMFDRLPELVLSRFPQINLLVAYPAQPEAVDAVGPAAPAAPAAERRDGPKICPVNLAAGISAGAMVAALVAKALPAHSPATRDIRAQLEHAMEAYPLELHESVAMLHARCEVRAPMLLVGYGATGWRFRNLAGEYRIVLALLTPKGKSPEWHLNTLSGLARRFLDPEFAGSIGRAADAEAVCRLLR
jgi:Kef-type K+ transport system membrane component KefB/nucleotide-binding universal stress UspA family protein/mannitol/fructose-specific phosphotransferase system IIA component (Ntr-type)